MTILPLGLLVATGLLVGSSIGCIGIGGVVLVPILIQVFAIPVHEAVPIAMAGFAMAGAAGTWRFARSTTIDWSMAFWLWVGAMPAAIAGSLAVKALPASALELAIAALATVCGLQSLRRAPADLPTAARSFPPWLGVVIGAGTGFGSALTGTSGPVILIPLLLWSRVPMIVAIGLAITVQLPIASVATISYLLDGSLTVLPGLALGLGLSAGAYLGSHIAPRLDQLVLKRSVASVLIGTGLFVMVSVALQNTP